MVIRKTQQKLEGRWRRWSERSPLLLAPISCIYGAVVWLRNLAYDRGWFSISRVGVPVVSVGNLTVGGTGKTPVVMELARLLEGKVAIVTRGYGGEAERKKRPTLISDGAGPLHSWKFCGDEAYLLASSLPGVLVVAGPDRVAGARLATERGAELVLLDDGMQHRRLHRDVEIVVVDGRKGLEGAHLFPRGELREPLAGLKRADFVLATYCSEAPVGIALPPRYTCEGIEGRRVGLFCAIGHPEGFMRTVEGMGAEVVLHRFFPDHAPLDGEELRIFAARAAVLGAEVLVCTAKDRVKVGATLPLPIRVVDLSFTIPQEIVASITAKTVGSKMSEATTGGLSW